MADFIDLNSFRRQKDALSIPFDIFVGIDWSEDWHDYAAVDPTGVVLERGRIKDDLDGLKQLLVILDQLSPDRPTAIVLETDRLLLVDELRRTRHHVYAINPKATARYRDRHKSSGGKSDKTDAVVLANIARTDLHVHRPLPRITMPVRALNQVARAHDDSGRRSRRVANELRSLLRLYYPNALIAFDPAQLVERPTLEVLRRCPTPAEAATASVEDVADALRRGGRQRSVSEAAHDIHATLVDPSMRVDDTVEEMFGAAALALIQTLIGHAAAKAHLEAELKAAMTKLGLDTIIEPVPGMGLILGARILSEIGDDLARFPTADALKGYAGTAPITISSGKGWGTHVRWSCNKRLQHSAYLWADRACLNSAGARLHYDRKRTEGKRRSEALRHLSNRLVGCLWHCLTTGEQWSDLVAFGVEGRPPKPS